MFHQKMERNPDSKNSFKKQWILDQYNKMKPLYPGREKELQEFLLSEYEKREVPEGRFFNNTTKDNKKVNLEQFIYMYLNNPYILSGYSCLFKDQEHSINIASDALVSILNSRKKYKNRMEAADYGSQEYVYNRVLQLVFKVLANSYYGILGQQDSIFYNPFIQNSTTMSGQDFITTSIIAVESFMENNCNFNDTDEILNFIHNIRQESNSENKILDYLNSVSSQELLEYLKSISKNDIKEDIVLEVINTLTDEERTRVYWKNNFKKLVSEKYFKDKITSFLKYDYLDKIPEEMEGDFNKFKELVLEFTFYNCLIADRFKRATTEIRRSVVTIDTDSVFINLHNIINKIEEDNKSKFVGDKRQTVSNIIINIVTDVIGKTIYLMTNNLGICESHRSIMNMKNEFIYSRIITTVNKKSYAGMITSQLGKRLNKPELDIKGLAIKKSSTPKLLREKFQKILVDQMLLPEKVDIKKIIDEYDAIEDDIEKSLSRGELTYSIPKNIELIEKYADPDKQEQVRGTIIWNALEKDDQITPPDKINILKLNCIEKDDPRLLKLEQTNKDKYDIIMKVVFKEGVNDNSLDFSRFGFNVIAFPKSVTKVPDYLIPFIDLRANTSNNIQNGNILLSSLGVYCPTESASSATLYKTNIIEI